MQLPFISMSSNNDLVQVQDAADTEAEKQLLCLQCLQLPLSSKGFCYCCCVRTNNCWERAKPTKEALKPRFCWFVHSLQSIELTDWAAL